MDYGPQLDIQVKHFGRLNLLGLPCWTFSISMYYGPQSDIPVQSDGRLTFARASMLNYECLDILWASNEHPSLRLWSFEFAQSFHVKFWASWYIIGFNQTSKSRVMAIWIFPGIPCSISSILIYYGTQSNTRVQSDGHLNLPGASMLNFESLDIL